MTLPAGGGHCGFTHWKPPPVLMQEVPPGQSSWDRAHSSMSGKQGKMGQKGAKREARPPAHPTEGFVWVEKR